MRINEIANAEEQLALWKLVSNSVWAAIQTQAQQQAKQKALKVSRKPAKVGYRLKPRVLGVASAPRLPVVAVPQAKDTTPKSTDVDTARTDTQARVSTQPKSVAKQANTSAALALDTEPTSAAKASNTNMDVDNVDAEVAKQPIKPEQGV